MPTQSELNQFRRLTGDYGKDNMSDTECGIWLDDATDELTDDFATPLYSFDYIAPNYHTEIIYKAALNYWWLQLASLQDKHTQTIGTSSANISEKWQRAMDMTTSMNTQWEAHRTMGFDVHVDNYSRFSKQTLRRIGGIREEDTNS